MNLDSPQSFYEHLIAKTSSVKRKSGLKIVHEICEQKFTAKDTDWKVSSIARSTHELGGPSPDSFRQRDLDDYRALIAVWKKYSGSKNPSKPSRDPQFPEWIDVIDNIVAKQMARLMWKDLSIARAQIRRLESLRGDGGVLRIANISPEVDAQKIGPTPNQIRELRSFINIFIDSKVELQKRGIKLEQERLIDEDSGEILLGSGALEALRRITS